MSETEIVKDRVQTSEVVYKRLFKLAQNLCSNDEGAEKPSREQLATEIGNYRALLTKLQLQINMNLKEKQHYDEECEQNQQEIASLVDQTVELKNQWQDAKEIKAQRQQYNQLIDDMNKAKKVKIEGGTKAIVAQLSTSRDEDRADIEQTRQDIEDLKQQKAHLQQCWVDRRAKFDELVQSLGQYRKEIVRVSSNDEDEDEDEDIEDEEGEERDEDGDQKMAEGQHKNEDRMDTS